MHHSTYLQFLKTIFWVLAIWFLAFLVVWNRSGTPENNEDSVYPKTEITEDLVGQPSSGQAEHRRRGLLMGMRVGWDWINSTRKATDLGFGLLTQKREREPGIQENHRMGGEITKNSNDPDEAGENDETSEKSDEDEDISEELNVDEEASEAKSIDQNNEDEKEDDWNLSEEEKIPAAEISHLKSADDFLEPNKKAALKSSTFRNTISGNWINGTRTNSIIPDRSSPKGRKGKRGGPLIWQTDQLEDRNLPDRYGRLKRNIRQVCDGNGLNVESEEPFFATMDTSHILVHEDLRIIWCMVPKSGSTLWRKILTGLATRVYDVPMVTNLPTTFSQTSRYLYSYTPQKAAEMLRSFPKFMFTRHPFQRLHSAYIDKILGSNNYIVNSIHEEIKSVMKLEALLAEHAAHNTDGKGVSLPTFGDEETIITRGLEGERGSEEEDQPDDDKPLTFPQFLTYVTNHDHYFPNEPMNGHWQPSFNMCMPCTIAYDFVGRLEDMAEDGRALFNLFRFDRRMKFPADHKPNHSFRKRSETRDMFRALPPDLYREIYKVYAHDFEMFNYTDEGYETDSEIHYNYNHITSLLKEDEPIKDLATSDITTTLPQGESESTKLDDK